jgi:methylmalonyl-CoA mutase N-terminal domain/subunit
MSTKIKANALSAVRGAPSKPTFSKKTRRKIPASSARNFRCGLMGDVQEYFINHKVSQLLFGVDFRVSHRRSGANPISQLAFTLANGFTFVEYYLSRG